MPHKFILEYLYPMEMLVKKVFGNPALYVEDKIFLVLSQSESNPVDNGLWISTSLEYHDSLQKQIPALKKLQAIHMKKWLLLPEDVENFEEVALEICALIKDGDPRIGVVVKR